MHKARFIYDCTEKNADLYYLTKFRAPDSFIFFEVNGKKYMVINSLEIDRARKSADVDRVLLINKYVELAGKKKKAYTQSDVIHEILVDYKIRKLVVPTNTSFTLVDDLRKKGYKIEAGATPFCSERFVKTPEELGYIKDAQRIVFAAIKLAEETLRKSRIKNNKLFFKGKRLTSEYLQTKINSFLLEHDFLGSDTIVSSGVHAMDPHDTGSGPIGPNQSVIVDIFPRSLKTFYFGDATRTFCRGHASEALKKMYATVKKGQELGIAMVRAGVKGKKIHSAIHSFFAAKGYETCEKNGRQQGFFHGTGHSVGLEIHEEPARIGPRDYTLKSGNVMSVEPGLYYQGIGGVRIEDLVCVTKTGCKIISGYPKRLEI